MKNNHWHECTCGAKEDKGAHSYGDWIVTKPATESAAGLKVQSCSVCKYQQTEVIPQTGNSGGGDNTESGGNTGVESNTESGGNTGVGSNTNESGPQNEGNGQNRQTQASGRIETGREQGENTPRHRVRDAGRRSVPCGTDAGGAGPCGSGNRCQDHS